MGKVLLFSSACGLLFLLVFGIHDPDNPMVWMASTSEEFVLLRGFLIVVLLGLLVTHPPRNVFFRSFVGLLSVSLAGWASYATYNNEMKFLDTMALLQFSISAGIVALERRLEAAPLPWPRYDVAHRW